MTCLELPVTGVTDIDLMAKEIVDKAQPGTWGKDFKW
jgi:hypothetical protein